MQQSQIVKYNYPMALLSRLEDFPTLFTDRLKLRQVNRKDLLFLYNNLSIPDVTEYMDVYFPTLMAMRRQIQWYNQLTERQEGIQWMVETKDRKPVGVCGFHNWKKEHCRIEIGYWSTPIMRQKGFIKEALSMIIAFAFEKLETHRIEAYIDERNERSINVLKKLNFLLDATLRDYEFDEHTQTYNTTLIFSLLKTDKQNGYAKN